MADEGGIMPKGRGQARARQNRIDDRRRSIQDLDSRDLFYQKNPDFPSSQASVDTLFSIYRRCLDKPKVLDTMDMKQTAWDHLKSHDYCGDEKFQAIMKKSQEKKL